MKKIASCSLHLNEWSADRDGPSATPSMSATGSSAMPPASAARRCRLRLSSFLFCVLRFVFALSALFRVL